jgi:hypothetical protein
MNALTTDTTSAKTVSGYKLENAYLVLGYAQLISAKITLCTKTVAKTSNCVMVEMISSTNYQTGLTTGCWADTATAWTSLGTITFPFAQSGKIIIRRII